MAVDITINETIDVVDITVNPNIIEVNVTRTSGGGGSQTLAQTLDLGNQTGGENILVNNADAIELENGSKLSEGLYDEGTFGNKGIARTCAVGYEDKWEAGEQYITETGSGIIQFRRFAFNVPTVDDDTTKRYAVGSYWQMRNNDIYICTDPTTGAAVWEIYSVGGIPTLQQVLTEDNQTGGIPIYSNDETTYLLVDNDGNIVLSSNFGGLKQIIISEDSFEFQSNLRYTFSGKGIIINTADDGFGLPRLTTTLMNDIPFPTEGMIVWNTTESSIYQFNGTIWEALTSDIPTKTSDLINDGDNGTSHFISLEDLPSTLTLYPTTAASGIGGYNKLVSSITDPDYNTTAVDVSTGAITGTDQLIAGLITEPNIIIGNPGVFNMTTLGNIRKTSGSGQAEFFFRVYKRDAGGTETLILQSSDTPQITSAIYTEFNASGLWNDGIFLSTDRIVIKFYGTKVGGGSDPTYDFQFGGAQPIRSIVPVPLNVLPVLSLDELTNVTITGVTNNQLLSYTSATDIWENKTIVEDSITNGVTTVAPSQNAVFDALALKQNNFILGRKASASSTLTGTTTETILESIFIPAGSVAVGDVIYMRNRLTKLNASSNGFSIRYRVNTSNSISGSSVLGLATLPLGPNYRSQGIERTINLRASNIIEVIDNTSSFAYENATTILPNANITFTYTSDFWILITAQLANAGDSIANSNYIIQKY
jgi:hypothetical protein